MSLKILSLVALLHLQALAAVSEQTPALESPNSHHASSGAPQKPALKFRKPDHASSSAPQKPALASPKLHDASSGVPRKRVGHGGIRRALRRREGGELGQGAAGLDLLAAGDKQSADEIAPTIVPMEHTVERDLTAMEHDLDSLKHDMIAAMESETFQQHVKFSAEFFVFNACFMLLCALVYRWCKRDGEAAEELQAGAMDFDVPICGCFRNGCCLPVSMCFCFVCCWHARWADTMQLAGQRRYWVAVLVLLLLDSCSYATYGVSLLLLLCFVLYQRRKLRAAYGVDTGGVTVLEDCCIYCHWPFCAIIQEAQQVETRALPKTEPGLPAD